MKVLSIVLLASVFAMPMATLAGPIGSNQTASGGSACPFAESTAKARNPLDAKSQAAPAPRSGQDSKAIAVDTSSDSVSG
jgi:hypothetical protein